MAAAVETKIIGVDGVIAGAADTGLLHPVSLQAGGLTLYAGMSNQITVMPRRLKAIAPTVDAPIPFECVIFKALAKKPDDRFQSMSEMRKALTTSQQKSSPLRNALSILRLSTVTKKQAALALALLAFVCLAAYPTTYKLVGFDNRRRISFPRHSVGTLYAVLRNSKGALSSEEDIGPAQGIISVPKDALIRLANVPAAESSLAFLANLGPDDLQYLDLSQLPVSDKALLSVARLKGLQSLNIDGTDVSDLGLQELKLPPRFTQQFFGDRSEYLNTIHLLRELRSKNPTVRMVPSHCLESATEVSAMAAEERDKPSTYG